MRVLIIKTSSMGDVIHTLPALTDAGRAIPAVTFDWVIEESFAEIPYWHPLVNNVIPVALRRWRKNFFKIQTHTEWKQFRKTLRATEYDIIIDAQGLLKSAWLTFMAKGKRCGLDWHSTKERLASLFYQYKYHTDKTSENHAISRIRNSFSQVLGYDYPKDSIPDYGIDRTKLNKTKTMDAYLVFIHSTTWQTKHWPEEYWIELAKIAHQHGLAIKLPWGNSVEYERAQRIATHCEKAEVLPQLTLADMAHVIAGAKAIVSVDTGLGHLAAALDVPTVSLYGPTSPQLTGALGKSQVHLSVRFPCAPCFKHHCTYQKDSSTKLLTPLDSPCFSTLPPIKVWDTLAALL